MEPVVSAILTVLLKPMLILCDSGIALADATICREDVTRTYSHSGQICNKCDSRYAVLAFFLFSQSILCIRTISSRSHYPALSVGPSRVLAGLGEQALPGRI